MQFQRQIQLKEIGLEGQSKIFQSKILVIGLGGLGCPVATYLVSSGIGEIGLVDFDVVESSNLPRQTLYNVHDIGKNKTTIAKEVLSNFNPTCKINTYPISINNTNAEAIISSYDMVVDCTDNFATRYAINDICSLLSKPLIYGSVYGYEGQVGVFNIKDKHGIEANYRHIFPNPPQQNEIPNCNETGVLGVLTGFIGTIQATEVIKLITGINDKLANRLLTFSLKSYSTQIIKINSNNSVPEGLPKSLNEYKDFDYQVLCGAMNTNIEIDFVTFNSYLNDETLCILDVRNLEEKPTFSDKRKIQIPLDELPERLAELPIHTTIVVICQHGIRSLFAAQYLREELNSPIIYSLKNGIESWFMQTNS